MPTEEWDCCDVLGSPLTTLPRLRTNAFIKRLFKQRMDFRINGYQPIHGHLGCPIRRTGYTFGGKPEKHYKSPVKPEKIQKMWPETGKRLFGVFES